MGQLTILTIADDATHALAESAVAGVLPSAEFERVDPAFVRRLPPSGALIVADAAHARIARATGFEGAILIIGTPKTAEEREAFRTQGAEFVDGAGPAKDIADALLTACQSAADGTLHTALVRARRLIAAGEVALTLQHDFNNPLAALMAEVQMLEIDAPNAEVQATAARMLELVRRLTALSRSLDGVRDRKTGS